jgi:hypothetical protein
MSPQAFMLGAIEQTVLAVEQRASFVGEALAAAQEVHEVGVGYAADDVHAYIDARLAGKNADRPAPSSSAFAIPMLRLRVDSCLLTSFPH